MVLYSPNIIIEVGMDKVILNKDFRQYFFNFS